MQLLPEATAKLAVNLADHLRTIPLELLSESKYLITVFYEKDLADGYVKVLVESIPKALSTDALFKLHRSLA